MTAPVTLSMTSQSHASLMSHLFPGDGSESAAILLCASVPEPRLRLLVRDVLVVPHEACTKREPDGLTWPGWWIEEALDRAEGDGLSLILIHSHPGGYFDFSEADTLSDNQVIPCLFQAHGLLHGTAIMTPDGAIRARLYRPSMEVTPVELISVYGDDIKFIWNDNLRGEPSRRPLAFSSDMTAELNRLSAAVIGVSGTGSIVAEQLARLGCGRVTLIDFDHVEPKNLNRILNSTLSDALAQRLKVDVLADAISTYRGENVAIPISAPIGSAQAVLAASQSDLLFCCVDTLEARHIADLMSSAFLLPLFDVGVVIPVRRSGSNVALADVCGRIDYVKPGGSSLRDRGVYSPESLRAEYLRQVAPEAHQRELDAGYIRGLIEEAPAVITLNMRAAAGCVNEMIARAYPFRQDGNEKFARTLFSLAACEEEYVAEGDFTSTANHLFARGGIEPLLGLPALNGRRAA